MNLPPASHPGQSSRRREGAGRAEGKGACRGPAGVKGERPSIHQLYMNA